MGRRPTVRAITNVDLSSSSIAKKLDTFIASGGEIEKVAPGATGQDEKNRTKHIVISRKAPPPPPGLVTES